MKKAILAACLALMFGSALASNYYLVVPVPSRAVASNILVTLNPYSLPNGVVGSPYAGFDFNNVLQVSGDASFDPTGVVWSVVDGALPAGLALGSDGKLAGALTAAGTTSMQVRATYKGKAATQGYSISSGAAGGIAQFSGYRSWADGTFGSSCNEYLTGKPGHTYSGSTGDGVYRIDVDGAGPLTPVDVVCDMTTDGGGWTVFQRRVSGALDFYRTYAEYANGFGNTIEYWMGNDRLAAMTAGNSHALRIDLARSNGQTAFAQYGTFRVGPASTGYVLTIKSFLAGAAGDSLTGHDGHAFNTWDVNSEPGSNCAVLYHGAWWYDQCHQSNLNGAYLNGPHASFADGMEWYSWTGYNESMAKTEMKVR